MGERGSARFELPALPQPCRRCGHAHWPVHNENAPLLGAPLSSDERIQFVQPSATAAGTVAICIRKPSGFLPRLGDFQRQGIFSRVQPAGQQIKPFEQKLLMLKEEGRHAEFLCEAVLRHQIIVVADKTGSGETTLMKALVEEVPVEERQQRRTPSPPCEHGLPTVGVYMAAGATPPVDNPAPEPAEPA